MEETKIALRNKIYYFVFSIILIVYFLWAGIGISYDPTKLKMWYFYSIMALFAWFCILFDWATIKRFSFVNTITIEETPIPLKYVVIISIVGTILYSFNIIATQTAFVPYPQFQIFDYPLPNAILSGVAGWIENLFFFGVLLGIVAYILTRKAIPEGISSILSIIIVAFIFMSFHIFVYGANQPAIVSTLFFAFICGTTSVFLRTILFADALHFTNNLIASLIQAGVAFVVI